MSAEIDFDQGPTMSLLCRIGWHRWTGKDWDQWGNLVTGTCSRCGRSYAEDPQP